MLSGRGTVHVQFRSMLAATIAVGAIVAQAGPATADTGLELALQDIGQRDYYCTATFALTAANGSVFQDINGYFYLFVDGEQVGRSKGSSFLFEDGQTSASAVFETPNAPCTDVNGYVFVVGACMKGNSFADRTECAAAIASSGPVREVKAR